MAAGAPKWMHMSEEIPRRSAGAHRRLGGLMIAAAWLVVIGIVSILFGDLLESQHNPNQQPVSAGGGDAARVLLRQNRLGHYVASGQINGEPVVFLVDTGATQVSVPAPLARRLGLRSGAPMSANTANGVVTTYATTLAQVQLGDIVLRDVRASINPGMRSDEVLLGMSFLRHLELTQRDGTLTLTQRHSG